MRAPTIDIEGLCLRLGRKRVLEQVSLRIEGGESFALVGPNGAGKTSLVGCVLGLVRPQSGRVRIGGRRPDDPLVRRSLGYVPERPSLDRSLTARATLRLHHRLADGEPAAREATVVRLLERTGLEDAADERVRCFSKGMLQRLSFAVALVGRPRLLVLDEPFSGVDPAGVAALRVLIAGVRAEGATLLLNSHRLDQVHRLCDRVALLARGRVASVGSTGSDAAALERLVVDAAAGGAA